jgi:hypothetical protein
MSDPSDVYINNTNTQYKSQFSIIQPMNASKVDNYYNNFSKYVLSNTNVNKKTMNEPAFTYTQYKLNELHIEKYKLTELKTVAKHYNLHISGNKNVIVDRILSFFRKTKAVIHIQKHFRGNLVRLSRRLRGEAYNDVSKCVNECDFYTLEPLSEISKIQFFSYTDEKGFVYGFDIISLITLLKKTSKIINPYNREQIPYDICTTLLGLYQISRILFPSLFTEENTILRVDPKPIRRIQPRPLSVNTIVPTQPDINANTNVNNIERLPPPLSVYEETIVFDTHIPRETAILNTLTTLRSQPADVRIRELFMEINLLGNYAESRWFSDLDRLRLARFYQFYHEWWTTRSRLSSTIRKNICMLGDPFEDIRLVYLYPTTEIEEYREACLKTMEMMVYGGIDLEYRKLGILQLLSILTIVSIPARNAMPWLYESILI